MGGSDDELAALVQAGVIIRSAPVRGNVIQHGRDLRKLGGRRVSAYPVGRDQRQPIESRRYCPGVFPHCRLKALLKEESDS
jgi:hypothetical protein